ncbi:MAG: cytochrome c peroxidase [Verrucomicrobiota bacterium]|jgi:cytochrome c peroxidase
MALGASLNVQIVPRFNNAPLVFDSITNTTTSRQNISVTRLDFLVSNFALRNTNGNWIEQTNRFAFINAREGRTGFSVNQILSGRYDRIRFHIGVDPAINHSDVAQYPAAHPLNPDVNGLHWGWMGGYVFLAIEGNWSPVAAVYDRRTNLENATVADRRYNELSGYSYHLATDRQFMTIELPIALNLISNAQIQLALNVDKIFSAPINDTNLSTHSRTNDIFADQLHRNVESAFAIVPLEGRVPRVPNLTSLNNLGRAALVPPAHKVEMASKAKPYGLTISKFFPQPDLPRDNPLTGEGVSLGSELFFDRRLSGDNSQSCARCHHPREAFSENRRFSRGIGGEVGTRNAMPLVNLAWKKEFFWDGRAASLREQVLQPIQNPIEMHQSLPQLVSKLSADTNYHRLFANAFGSPEITTDRIARALEQFLLVQVSFDSKFDRAILGQEKFTADEQRGFELFHTEYDPRHGQFGADCFHCHGGPLFQSQSFGNNGLDARFKDLGRFAVTKREGDQGKFSVPSLRNVALTAPYMHDGRFRTLEEVVEHYCTGMVRSSTLDPNLAKHPNNGVPLNAADKRALVAFLKTLTEESLK